MKRLLLLFLFVVVAPEFAGAQEPGSSVQDQNPSEIQAQANQEAEKIFEEKFGDMRNATPEQISDSLRLAAYEIFFSPGGICRMGQSDEIGRDLARFTIVIPSKDGDVPKALLPFRSVDDIIVEDSKIKYGNQSYEITKDISYFDCADFLPDEVDYDRLASLSNAQLEALLKCQEEGGGFFDKCLTRILGTLLPQGLQDYLPNNWKLGIKEAHHWKAGFYPSCFETLAHGIALNTQGLVTALGTVGGKGAEFVSYAFDGFPGFGSKLENAGNSILETGAGLLGLGGSEPVASTEKPEIKPSDVPRILDWLAAIGDYSHLF